jgi:hypothetical protein
MRKNGADCTATDGHNRRTAAGNPPPFIKDAGRAVKNNDSPQNKLQSQVGVATVNDVDAIYVKPGPEQA